jgi:hypothetical protein
LTSEKKIEANRANALKSTGPKTARGKSHSRNNALKVGVHAAQGLLPGEDEEAYRDLAAGITSELEPKGMFETMIVDHIIKNFWRLTRLDRAEVELFESEKSSHVSRYLRTLDEQQQYFVAEELGGEVWSGYQVQKRREANANGELNDDELDLNEGEKQELLCVLKKFSNPLLALRTTIVPDRTPDALQFILTQRRALWRDIYRDHAELKALQKERKAREEAEPTASESEV